MKVERKTNGSGTKFRDIDRGAVFMINGFDSLYMKTGPLTTDTKLNVNSVLLEGGSWHEMSQNTVVIVIHGKFVEDED